MKRMSGMQKKTRMEESSMRRLQWQRSLIWLLAGMLCFVVSAHAQTDAMLAPIGGSGGGQFTGRCPAGQLLNGVELRTGDDVDSIKPICVLADTGQLQPYPGRFGGQGGGAPTPYICPHHDPIVTGIKVAYEGLKTLVVNNIHLLCGVASTSQVREFPGAGFDGPRAEGSIWKFVGAGRDEQRCPAGLVAVGIHGRSGIWLDAVGLICGAPKLTPATVVTGTLPGPTKALGRVGTGVLPGPTKALGRVSTGTTPGPSVSICEAARMARARNSSAAAGLENQCRALQEKQASAQPQPAPSTAPAPVGQASTLYADRNPVMIPDGQASGTAIITWKAASAQGFSEIYRSIDNGPWSEFGTGPAGSKPTTIQPGSSHAFHMLVDDGQQSEPEIVEITVTAAQDPRPASTPPSKSDPKVCVYARQARALNLPVATNLEALCRAAGGTI